ncbi:MAG: ATP-binding cassette domain-containing protein [Granulosicoccus sp.]
MSNPASSKNLFDDSLLACVEMVLEFHQHRVDLAGLRAELPRNVESPADRWRLSDLPNIARHLDLELSICRTSNEDLMATQVPLIVPLIRNRFAVIIPVSEGKPSYCLPGDLPVELSDAHLTQWSTGRVFVMNPRPVEQTLVTGHMERQRPIDWFWQPILRYTPSFVEVIICTVFINLLVIALPLFTLNVYDSVVPNLAMSTLTVLALGVAFAIVFDVLLKVARSSVLERIASRTGTQFDGELMSRMLRIRDEQMPLSVGERSNLFRELRGLRDFYATRLVPALVDFPFFLLFLLTIYLISPILTLVPMGIAFSILSLNLLCQIPIKRTTRDLFSSTQQKSSMMIELLSGSSALKQLNATGSSLGRWQMAAGQSAEVSRRSQAWMSFAQYGSLGLMQANHVLIVVVGVYQIQGGYLTIGGLVASTILASRTIAPIMNLHSVIARWTQSRDCLRAIDQLFTCDLDTSTSRIVPDAPLQGNLVLSALSYTYPNKSRPALKSINLNIRAGENVCLVGPSGAGKSTLAKTIAGALGGFEGHMSIDGFDYRALCVARLRSSVALIPQTPFLMSGSVRDNLLLGITDITERELNRAVQLSGLDQVLVETGTGLDTETGEGGMSLSGGQKQAISIARAVLRNPAVLVFDEPTTGLDASLEKHFVRSMKEFSKDRTLIIVTHRTALVSLTERVVLMDKGGVVTDGKRDSVMQQIAA